MRKKVFLKILFQIILLFSFSTLQLNTTDLEDQSLAEKAAEELLNSMSDIFGDLTELSNMSGAEKLNYVLTKAEDRIKEKIIEDKVIKDELKEKIKDYARQSLRAKLFTEIAEPKIKDAIARGVSFDWNSIDLEISNKLDAKMNLISAGLDAAQIGWDAYKAYSEGDFYSAIKSIGGNISDLLAESYLPAYTYIKIGASVVESLGKYVISYANQTAFEGILEDMYSIKENPTEFANWVINKTPSEIEKDIRNKWEVVGYKTRFFEGRATEKGEEEMIAKIKNAVISMRGEILIKKREEEAKRKQIYDELEMQIIEPVRLKEKELQKTAQLTLNKAQDKINKIREFKIRVLKMKEEKVKEKIKEIEQNQTPPPSMFYATINPDEIFNLYMLYFDEIKETPNTQGYKGYNKNKLSEYWFLANKKFKENEKNARETLKSQLETTLSKTEPEKRQPILNDYEKANKKIDEEIALLNEKINIEKIEAKKRREKFKLEIKKHLEDLSSKIRKAKRERNEKLSAWLTQVDDKIPFSNLIPNIITNKAKLENDVIKSYSCLGICGYVEEINRNSKIQISLPGNLYNKIFEAESSYYNLKNAIREIPSLITQRKKIHLEYNEEITNIKKTLESLVDNDLIIYNEHTLKTGISLPSVEFFKPAEYLELDEDLVLDEFDADAITTYIFKSYEEIANEIQQNISILRYYADMDFIADRFIKIANKVYPKLRELMKSPDFEHKDGKKISLTTSIYDTDGAKQIEIMKKLWNEIENDVIKLENMKKSFKKGAISYFNISLDELMDQLDEYKQFPKYIEKYSKQMEEKENQRKNSISIAETSINDLKTRLNSLKQKNQYSKEVLEEIEVLKRDFNYYLSPSIMRTDSGFYLLKSEFEKLKVEFDNYLLEREKFLKEDLERLKNEYEQQIAKEAEEIKKEEERKQKEYAKKLSLETTGSLASFYGYYLINPELNGKKVFNQKNLVLFKNELRSGLIEISAKLSTIKNVSKLIFSPDDGISWREIEKTDYIRIRFTPLSDKIYKPLLRIKTIDYEDIDIYFFGKEFELIYKDIDYNTNIVNAIKKIADFYETKNILGFAQMISEEYIGNKNFLLEGVRFDFDMFDNINLKIYINKIEKRNELFIVETKWDKMQTPKKTLSIQKTSGKTIFVFVIENGNFKLQNLRGNLIFATLSPEIAQASGLPQEVVDEIKQARDKREPSQPGAKEELQKLPIKYGSVKERYAESGDCFSSRFASGFDFSNGIETESGDVDFWLEINMFFAVSPAAIREVDENFDDINYAPETGYVDDVVLDVGKSYVFITKEGYYGKLEIISVDDKYNYPTCNYIKHDFRYAIQKDGSRNLRTK